MLVHLLFKNSEQFHLIGFRVGDQEDFAGLSWPTEVCEKGACDFAGYQLLQQVDQLVPRFL